MRKFKKYSILVSCTLVLAFAFSARAQEDSGMDGPPTETSEDPKIIPFEQDTIVQEDEELPDGGQAPKAKGPAMRQEKREKRRDAREENRKERQEKRANHREHRQDHRKEKRADRKENREERRKNR